MSWFQIIDAKSGAVTYDTRETSLTRDPETNESEVTSLGDRLDNTHPMDIPNPRWAKFVKEIEASWAEREALLSKMENQVIEGKKRQE